MTWAIPTPTDSTLQDSVATLPRWMNGTRIGAVLQVVARCGDALGDYVTAAVKFWFPGYYADDTLPTLGRERRIYRGPEEPSASFSGRLSIFRQTHQRAGAWSVGLEQLRAYWTGSTYEAAPWFPLLEAVSNAAKMCTLAADGTFSVAALSDLGRSWQWDSDSPPGGPMTAHPTRYWILLHMPDGIAADATGMQWGKGPKLGDGQKLGDGTLLGCSSNRAQIDSLKQIVAAWNPPHAQCEHLVVIYDEDAWTAGQPESSNWDRWANRNRSVSYMHGTRP